MSKYEGHTPGPWQSSRADMLSFNGDDGVQESFVYRGDRETADSRICVRPYGKHGDPVIDANLIADSPALAERTRRALNKLRYMASGGSFLAPAHSDIEHLIRILEGEEDKE